MDQTVPREISATLAAERRQVKMIYFAMIAAAMLYLYVLQVIAPPVDPNLTSSFKQIIWIMAAGMAGGVIYVRKTKIIPILEMSAVGTTDRARLRMFYIVAFALCETVLLYGFVLRVMGSTSMDALIPFAGGLVLFAINYPRWPTQGENVTTSNFAK